DGVRHHAVDAHEGQRKRDEGQHGEQHSVEAGPGDGAPEHILHRPNVAYRHVRVQLVDLTHHGGRQARRLDARARHDGTPGETPTVMRAVDGRVYLAVEVGGFDVTHDADDLVPGF